MHETGFVNEVFTVINQKLGQDGVSGKIVVHARLSPFSHVNPQCLQAAFNELIKWQNFKDVELKVLPLEFKMECKICRQGFQIAKRVFECPGCKSTDVDIKIDREFFVESLEIDGDD